MRYLPKGETIVTERIHKYNRVHPLYVRFQWSRVRLLRFDQLLTTWYALNILRYPAMTSYLCGGSFNIHIEESEKSDSLSLSHTHKHTHTHTHTL